MTEMDMDPRTAQLMEAARDLLQLSLSINGLGTEEKPLLPQHHVIHSASALSCLLHCHHERWDEYTSLIREVADQEGIF